MNQLLDYKQWLEAFPRLNWRSTFGFLLTPETLKAVEYNEYGVSCFVKGLQAEFIDKDYHEAFNWYENGAMQYDSLCLFRLHEIYIGNSAFNIEYNERQALCHLTYSALVSQFEVFDPKVSFWQKFEAFWKKEQNRIAYIQELLITPSADYFAATGPLFSKLFTFYTNKDNFHEALPELKALSTDALKKKFFPVLNAVFDFMAYTYNSGYSKLDLEKCVETILDMMTNDLLFDNFFQNYATHLKLLRTKKKFGVVFQRRLETDCFWIWSFSFLASMKNHYLALLLSFDETFSDGNVVLKWKNTSSWVNNFISFCFEKGIGTSKDINKSLDLYERDMNQMPRVLFSRLRKIIVLKQNRTLTKGYDDVDSLIENETKSLKLRLEERLEDPSRMDCYLYYVFGKLYEKVEDDINAAIDWYQKGVEATTDCCLKNHLLCNESWRMKCKRRLQKLQKRKGLQVMIVNKNQED